MIERLWAIVHQELSLANLMIAANCEDELRRMMDNAIDNIRQRYPNLRFDPKSLPAPVAQSVEDALRRFLKAMIQDARTKGYAELHEDTFHQARLGLCPGLWPFC